MIDPITYSLRRAERDSAHFYAEIETFTAEVVADAEARLGTLLAAFQRYVAESAHEPPRTRPEYAYELLTLGVLWRIYAHNALDLASLPQRALALLVQWRERGGFVKTWADRARGVLSALFLANNGHHATPTPTFEHCGRLLDWLAAVGDFEEEVARLRYWQTYWTTQPVARVNDQLAAVLAFAAWFEARSLAVLGPYTAHVERFLTEQHPAYRWREDRIFCGRKRVEYHLGMVGTQIMNAAFRETFLATKRKVVFAPPCMRARQGGDCQATPTPYGERCAACEPGCRVHQLTKLGEKHGFAVFMLPDDLAGLAPEATAAPGGDSLGVIGISCALTNASGGWKTRRYGIPAQGVLLDYVGCYWHWHNDGGIPTDINFQQVLRTVGAETQAAQKTPH